MNTKEEILDNVYNKSYDSLDGYSQTTALKAMTEYAQQEVIECLKWAISECVIMGDWDGVIVFNCSPNDAEGLYKQFKEHQLKK